MRNSLVQSTKIFFNQETLLPFFIGAIFLSVLGNAISQILFNVFGSNTKALLRISLGSVLIFTFCVWLVAKSLSKNRLPHMKIRKLRPKQHKGLILLVSREEPCRKAFEYHLGNLEHFWLICSPQTLDLAEKLKQDFSMDLTKKLKQNFFNSNIIELIVVNDVYEPIKFYHEVIEIYRHLPKGLTTEDIIADFTGMTAHASVGMVIASLSEQSSLQYTPADSINGKPTGLSLEPIEISINEKFSIGIK